MIPSLAILHADALAVLFVTFLAALFYFGPRIEQGLLRWAGVSATIPSIGRPGRDSLSGAPPRGKGVTAGWPCPAPRRTVYPVSS